MEIPFCIKLFSTDGDRILDPFGGSGSTALGCEGLEREVVLIDNKPDYVNVMKERLSHMKPKLKK